MRIDRQHRANKPLCYFNATLGSARGSVAWAPIDEPIVAYHRTQAPTTKDRCLLERRCASIAPPLPLQRWRSWGSHFGGAVRATHLGGRTWGDALGGTHMKRLLMLLYLALLPIPARGEFNVIEASIADLQRAMQSNSITSRELVQQYLERIAIYDRKLNAVITVNPNALRDADERDRERAQGKVRGPLHGIPIALKDNIHTTGMPTTGGALAFDGFVPP